MIYVLYEHVANYEDTEVNFIRAYRDRAKPEAVARAYNETPTLEAVIYKAVEVYSASLPGFVSATPPVTPRPDYDQTRSKDPTYNLEYKAMLKDRKRARKAHERAIDEERKAYWLAQRDQIDAFRDSLSADAIRRQHKTRDRWSTYEVAALPMDGEEDDSQAADAA